MQKNFLLSFTLIMFFFTHTYSEVISGNATVIDGDTIKINSKKIRLHGIDAPEIKQLCEREFLNFFFFTFKKNYKCGELSKKKLEYFIQNDKIECKTEGIDRYKRIIGTCFKNKININSKMVRNGYAVAYKKYSKKYTIQQLEAKKDNLGIWQGKFQMPWDWRKRNAKN